MVRRSKIATLLWLVAVLLLPMRIANAHLHMCLDGQASPVSMHMADVAAHCGLGHEADGHNDRDVDVSGALIKAKASTVDDGVAGDTLSAYVLAFLLPVQPHIVPEASLLDPTLSSASGLHPPVRGPPL